MKRSRSIHGAGLSALTPAVELDTRDAEIARQRGVITSQSEHILELNAQLEGLRSVIRKYRTKLAILKVHVSYLGRPLKPRPLARAVRKSKDSR